MKTIKSFNDFEKSGGKVEEQLFKNMFKKKKEKKAISNIQKDSEIENVRGVRGKEVWRDESGKKHKVIWKAQDTKNFIVKLVNDYDWLDDTGNLTPNGQTALLQFLNGEASFTNQYGKLDNLFFSKNIIVYTVKVDRDRRQKIQFSIADRLVLDQKADAIAQDGQQAYSFEGLKFINASVIVAIDQQLSSNMNSLIDTTILNVEDDTTPDPEDTEDTEDTDDTEDTESDEETDNEEDVIPLEDEALIGKQFEYQSGADGKLYLITVDRDRNSGGLKFWAKSKDGVDEGWVMLRGEEPYWLDKTLTDESPITNAKDKAFFIRIYTDMDYLKQLIADFEAKYPDGFDFTVKDLLYYNDGNKIYGAGPEEPEDYSNFVATA